MKRESKMETSSRGSDRKGERGAALVTMLLVTILMLGAGGALILSTAMSSTTAMGSTAEMQAYYVAESGMQSALNVIRGNTKPLVTAGDRMSFRAAVVPNVSNGPDNSGRLRLAGWLPYKDRMVASSLVPVEIGGFTGGFRVTIEDLDPLSHIVAFETSGQIEGSDVATPNSRTYNSGGTKEVTIRYQAQTSIELTPDPHTFPLTLDSTMGSFVIERPVASTDNDVAIPKTDFDLTITQTKPWAATTTLEGSFEGEVDAVGTTLKVTFDKAYVKGDGTTYTLNLGGTQVLDLSFPSSPATTAIPIKVTSPDPRKLLIKSYGFGPQGAEKRLELMVNRETLDLDMPAGTLLRGADDCSPLNLDTGSSGTKWYSGIDYSGVDPQRPSFAVSPCDKDSANSGIKKHDTVADPEIGLLMDDAEGADNVEQPSYLDTAAKARAFLNGLQAKAQTIGRYFNPGTGSTTISDSLNAPQFTFIDGNATLASGSGFLVVTGKLTMRGNTDFKGVILVLGQGELERNGGGNGEILGGITIAKFGRTSGDFLSPTFHTNGGGNSNVQYDSGSVRRAQASAINVSGIREF